MMSVTGFIFEAMIFFFKQKTSYEMRISDWSSDVCSSDLQHAEAGNCEVHSCLLPPLKTLAKTPALPARIPACFRNGKGRQALIYPVRWQRGKPWLRCVAVAEFGHNAADASPPGYDGLTNWKRSEEHMSALESLMRSSY